VKNYYKHIGVAEIKIENNPLKISDEIRLIGNKTGTFKQKVISIEINHKKISSAKRGQRVAIKTEKEARINDKVFVVRVKS